MWWPLLVEAQVDARWPERVASEDGLAAWAEEMAETYREKERRRSEIGPLWRGKDE